MKILINTEYSGLEFGIPALHRYNELAGTQMVHFSYIEDVGNHITTSEYVQEPMPDFLPVILLSPDDPELDNTANLWFDNISRNDKNLIQVFEEFGENISEEHLYNRLGIIEIPDNANWHVEGQDWGGETLVVKTVKINLDLVEDFDAMTKLQFVEYLERNPNVINFKEAYFRK